MSNISQAMNDRKKLLVRTLTQNPQLVTWEELKPNAAKSAEDTLRGQDEETLRQVVLWLKDQPGGEAQAAYKLVCAVLAWQAEHDYKQLKLW